jgi:hypothetical protein
MTIKTEFEFEYEEPITDEDDNVIDHKEPVIRKYTLEWAIEPAQNGGRTDPSWEAYAYMEGVTDSEGNEVNDKDVLAQAEREMERAFEGMKEDAFDEPDCDDFDEPDCFCPYD